MLRASCHQSSLRVSVGLSRLLVLNSLHGIYALRKCLRHVKTQAIKTIFWHSGWKTKCMPTSSNLRLSAMSAVKRQGV
ncbi:hypothetical protein BJX96DRAFT_140475 [Aspergillus floccosus]